MMLYLTRNNVPCAPFTAFCALNVPRLSEKTVKQWDGHGAFETMRRVGDALNNLIGTIEDQYSAIYNMPQINFYICLLLNIITYPDSRVAIFEI